MNFLPFPAAGNHQRSTCAGRLLNWTLFVTFLAWVVALAGVAVLQANLLVSVPVPLPVLPLLVPLRPLRYNSRARLDVMMESPSRAHSAALRSVPTRSRSHPSSTSAGKLCPLPSGERRRLLPPLPPRVVDRLLRAPLPLRSRFGPRLAAQVPPRRPRRNRALHHHTLPCAPIFSRLICASAVRWTGG